MIKSKIILQKPESQMTQGDLDDLSIELRHSTEQLKQQIDSEEIFS